MIQADFTRIGCPYLVLIPRSNRLSHHRPLYRSLPKILRRLRPTHFLSHMSEEGHKILRLASWLTRRRILRFPSLTRLQVVNLPVETNHWAVRFWWG